MNSIHSAQLDLNLLKTFDALFVTRSASRAAQALGVGQPGGQPCAGAAAQPDWRPAFRPHRRAYGADGAGAASGQTGTRGTDGRRTGARNRGIIRPARDRRIFTVSASDSLQPVLFSRVLCDLAAEGMRPALRLRSFDRDATLIAPDEGELDLAVGYLARVRRWHERQVLYEEGHVCLFNPDLLHLPLPADRGLRSVRAHRPVSAGEMTSFVDEAFQEHGLRRRVWLRPRSSWRSR